MADFEKAFQRLMKDEGFVLTDAVGDHGGQTYAGITRKNHSSWTGWRWIDAGDTPPTDLVRELYAAEYWLPLRANDIKPQRVAEVLFGQFVNMGSPAIKLAQTVLGVVADGKVGPKTLAAINAVHEEYFLACYALANIARYHAIGMKDKTQRKWWPGWIGRALRIVK